MSKTSGARDDSRTPGSESLPRDGEPTVRAVTAPSPALPSTGAALPAGGPGVFGPVVAPGQALGRSVGHERRRVGGWRRRRSDRHLRDALSRRQRLVLACFSGSWVGLSVVAWLWWFQPAHRGSALGMWVNSGLLAVESVVLPAWFLFFVWRARRADPSVGVPALRVAIVVTKAPSEPWPLVRQTLRAMLDQDFPLPYDAWLADESPSQETQTWCACNNVRISTREGVDAYQQSTWPRRARCKEGNLAYFYDSWGYDHYDVVAQLDADHIPERGYLRHMVAPFSDPMVGYVAAPSICDRNAQRSWSARARLYSEAVFHGPLQSGHSGGWAPSCIGSHYAVRTSALSEIGGLGPELAEDFTTTLMMSSRGWQGVFAADAEAHGYGPETAADCMTQELQWSRSMCTILIGINSRYWSTLSLAAKVRLGFCQIWYPVFAMLWLSSILVPLVAIVTRSPLMRVPLGGFYLHFVTPSFVLLGLVVWLRRARMLRPTDVRVLSWEAVVFQFARWPWVLIGCVQAVAGRIAGREFVFKVTPKATTGAAPLPVRLVIPYVVLAVLAASPALLRIDAGPARGYYFLTLLNAAIYLALAITLVIRHVYDHPRLIRRAAARISALTGTVTFGASILTAAALALAAPPIWSRGANRASEPRPWPVAASVASPITLGVTTRALAINTTRPWTSRDLIGVNAFEQMAHAHAGILLWFTDWTRGRFDPAQLREARRRGAIPEITWEPWNAKLPLRTPQPQFSLASIIDGRHDAYVREWARGLRAYGGPVLLRFAQEMNGDWYPWSEKINGNHPGEFVLAWRHVHHIFAQVGASNVKWVWSPVARFGAGLDITEYPGDRYVNVLGLSGFNGGTALKWTGWRTFPELFDRHLDVLHWLAPAKPIQISEVSTVEAGGSKAAWITQMFRDISAHPQVKSLVWFNLKKQADWRVETSPGASAAFRAGVASMAAPVSPVEKAPAPPPPPSPVASRFSGSPLGELCSLSCLSPAPAWPGLSGSSPTPGSTSSSPTPGSTGSSPTPGSTGSSPTPGPSGSPAAAAGV